MLNYPAAYQSTKGSALDVDKDFYRRIATEQDSRELVVPIRSFRSVQDGRGLCQLGMCSVL